MPSHVSRKATTVATATSSNNNNNDDDDDDDHDNDHDNDHDHDHDHDHNYNHNLVKNIRLPDFRQDWTEGAPRRHRDSSSAAPAAPEIGNLSQLLLPKIANVIQFVSGLGTFFWQNVTDVTGCVSVSSPSRAPPISRDASQSLEDLPARFQLMLQTVREMQAPMVS